MSSIWERLRSMKPAQLAKLPDRLTREQQAEILAGKTPAGKRAGSRKGALPAEPFPWAAPGRTLHLVLPGYLPPSLNEYSRKQSVRMRAVPECMQQLKLALLIARSDRRMFWHPRLEIGLWFPVSRRRDGRTNWAKIIEDALVDIGLMVDDSDDWCETVVHPTAADRDNPRTEVTLIERGKA